MFKLKEKNNELKNNNSNVRICMGCSMEFEVFINKLNKESEKCIECYKDQIEVEKTREKRNRTEYYQTEEYKENKKIYRKENKEKLATYKF